MYPHEFRTCSRTSVSSEGGSDHLQSDVEIADPFRKKCVAHLPVNITILL